MQYQDLLCVSTSLGTLIPYVSRICTLWFHKFAGLRQELTYVLQTLQWIGASELFDNFNRSLSYTMLCSKDEEE